MKSKSAGKRDGKYELSRARSFYEFHRSGVMQSRSGDTDRPILPYTPYVNDDPSWRFYAVNQNDTLLAVDVDVTDRITQDYISLKSLVAYRKHRDRKYLRSYTRYVYTLHRRTGEERAFYMTIVPSAGFMEKHHRRIRGITYLKRDEAFNGTILFHELDGTFVNGWTYARGEVTGKVLPESRARICCPDQDYKYLLLARRQTTYRVSLKLDNLSRADMDMDEDEDDDGGDLPDTDDQDQGSGGDDGSDDGWGSSGSDGDDFGNGSGEGGFGGSTSGDGSDDNPYDLGDLEGVEIIGQRPDPDYGSGIPWDPDWAENQYKDFGDDDDYNGSDNSGGGGGVPVVTNPDKGDNKGGIDYPQKDPGKEKVTKENFNLQVTTDKFFMQVKRLLALSLELKALKEMITFGNPSGGWGSAEYLDSTIYVKPSLFTQGWTIYDAQSTLFHEYVHYWQEQNGHIPERDEENQIVVYTYQYYYTIEDYNNAVLEFENDMREDEIPPNSELYNLCYEAEVLSIKDMYENEIPLIMDANRIVVDNDLEAMLMELEHFGSIMSLEYKQEIKGRIKRRQKQIKYITNGVIIKK